MVWFSDRRNSSSMYAIISLVAIICVGAVQAQLRQVSVLFAHGSRAPGDSPLETYPADRYRKYDYYPTGRGQLVIEGKYEEFELGEYLRKRYSTFIGDLYTPQSVSGLSSDDDNTKMSLQLVLAGIFPPSEHEKWNPHMNWQPIPTRYLLRAEDNIFHPEECPLFLEEYDRVLQSPEGKKQFKETYLFRKNLTYLTGKLITTPLDIYYLYQTVAAEYAHGLKLPKPLRNLISDGLFERGARWAYDIASSTPLLRKLSAGPYLNQVRKTMLDWINGTHGNGRKLYLYSGYDTNIAALLNALDVYKSHVPADASSVILELHEIHNNLYVKILYYLGNPYEVEELSFPHCKELCPLEWFLNIIEDLIPTQEELKCNKNITMKTPSDAEVDLMRFNMIVDARASGNRN